MMSLRRAPGLITGADSREGTDHISGGPILVRARPAIHDSTAISVEPTTLITSNAPLTIDAAAEPDTVGTTDAPVSWRHHYVPCFLLAGFTPSGRKSDRLWSFDNERAKPQPRTPKAVAFEP